MKETWYKKPCDLALPSCLLYPRVFLTLFPLVFLSLISLLHGPPFCSHLSSQSQWPLLSFLFSLFCPFLILASVSSFPLLSCLFQDFFFFIFLFLLIEKKLIIDSDYRIFTRAADMAHTPFWTCWRKAVVQHKLYCLYQKFRHNWAALFSSGNGGPLLKFKFLDASQGQIKADLSKNISQA